MTDWDWDRIVVDHVHLRTADLAASLDFYGALMAALDIPALWRDETGTQWANLVVTAGERTTTGLHMAFLARTRAEVDAFHVAGLAAGGRDNGPPGVRENYSSEAAGLYYAAFLLDPDGNNVEAVFRDTY
jgi:catechol 2,3-dioxygenase-like lactoylglutathione lyase family enzyme